MVASVGRCYTNPTDYAQENYYTDGESFINAEWLGKAANIQELNGQISEQDFLNAYSCLDPDGNPLRKQQQYQKSSRRYNRPGTDVTLSAPKSVSVAVLVYGNQDILKAHKAAVRATMKYVENNCIFYQTKQRGQKLLLQSETAQIAVFHHDDNRNKDPQLHSHCVILNQTHCPDGKWRAVANKELYKQQKTIGAYYDHELARQLQQLGYQVEWTSDHTLEIAGIDKEKLDTVFSTRSNQIEAELAQLGLTRSSATAEQKQALCLKTRKQKKQHHHPQDRIEQLVRWQTRARESEIEISKPTEYHRLEFERIYQNSDSENNLKNLISNAVSTLTERSAAFSPHELLRECLRQSQGKYNPEKIPTEIARSKELVTTRDGRLTTTEALTREQKIIQLALSGKDIQIPLSSVERAEAVSKSRSLNTGQTTALKQMVTSRDGVILIQGNAGVGKTYTMKAFAEIVGDERPKRGLAPSAAAASVLQTESGIASQTLASYLLTPKEQLPQQEVILVDEASMISTRSAKQLLEKASELHSRVILIGDTKQLSAIETGAPFKLLQDAGLPTAVIDQNLRQRDPSLKQIVNSLATHDKNPGSVNEAYQKLNESGKIKQIEEDESRIKAISTDYLSRPVAVRQKTLILASTNSDKQAIASSDSPKKPNGNYGRNKHQQIEQLKKQEKLQLKQLKLQKLELDSLGFPRSILNPFGVSADVIEDKRIEIQRTRSSIYNIQSQIRYVLPDFQQWQKQARAYLAWDESKSTKQMRQLEKDFSNPQIQQRVERLNDVYAVYAAASYILTQKGTESFKGRYYQGKSYRIEQQGKEISITHKVRDELLMLATDCREMGGIIQASQFNLRNEDKNIICNSARYLEQQVKELQKSRQIQRGGLSR